MSATQPLRIASIDDLMKTMAEAWPKAFPDHDSFVTWHRIFEGQLGHLSGDDLNVAWHACMDGWTKKTAPTPADFLKAFNARRGHGRDTLPNGQKPQSVADRIAAADLERRRDRRALIDAHEQKHAAGYAQASAEGWVGLLRTHVERTANLISQRNAQRRAGLEVPEWKREEHSHSDLGEGVPWVEITTIGDVDHIDISQATLQSFRRMVREPGPSDQSHRGRAFGAVPKHIEPPRIQAPAA